MPFTLSHPAAIVPLVRWTQHPLFVVTLVIGSIAPDIGYYLRMFTLATMAHSFAGTLLISAPAGMLLLGSVLFAKEPMLFLMPSRFRGHVAASLTLPSKAFPALVLQLYFWTWVGALTHVAWDSFTHRTGWMVERLPALQASFSISTEVSFPLYYAFQQTSTLFGFVIVLFVFYRYCVKTVPLPENARGDTLRYGFWTLLVTSSIALAVPLAVSYASHYQGFLQFRSIVFQTGVLSGSIFAVLLTTSLVVVAIKVKE